MHPGKRNEHHAWRPHIDSEQEFNPFAHAAVAGAPLEHRAIDEWDEYTSESEPQPQESEEAAIRKRTPP